MLTVGSTLLKVVTKSVPAIGSSQESKASVTHASPIFLKQLTSPHRDTMIIPPVAERRQFYVDIINKCEASLADRKQNNEAYRRYYLQGSLGDQKNVMQNRLRDKVNLLSSFLYAQETTKFGIKFDPHVPDEQRLYADKLREIAQDDWHNTDTDRSFGDATLWSLVYGCQFKKVIWNQDGLETYPLSPSCFGVLREDTDRIAHQEALSMTFYITRSELNRQLWKHERKDEILAELSSSKKDESSTIPEAVNRIIISQSSPSMIGSANANGQGIRQDYAPRVEEELVECRELWIWD